MVRTSGTVYETPTPCTGAGSLGSIFFTMVGTNAVRRFADAPEYSDVRLRLQKGASLLWEIHCLNASTVAAEVSAHVDFDVVEPGDGRELHRFIFSGGTAMSVPPSSEKTLSFSCPGRPVSTPLIFMNSHSHAHSDLVEVSVGGENIYKSTDWEAPLETSFDSLHDGVRVVPAGAAVDWSCHVRNTLSVPIVYGFSVQTKEMCVTAGFLIGKDWLCSLP
jgi:hypothetical protein